MSKDGGSTFEPVQLARTIPLTDIINAGDGRLGVTGPFGAMIVTPGAPPAP
jgi:hypothetical protein